MKKIYVSASTQYNNIGVNQYGTEQDRMMFLADRVKYFLETQGKFIIYRNQPNWTLQQTIAHCNTSGCDLFIDNHTNADQPNSQGTEVFYHGDSVNGKNIAQLIYDKIAPLSPGVDRGVKSDLILYSSGLAVLRSTNPPACLVEHFFHTNTIEVAHYLSHIDMYAKAEAMAICEYFGIGWVDTLTDVDILVKKMVEDGLITDVKYWTDVLNGKITANPQFLQVVLKRATDKI